ncbi:phosphoserine phosphatase SerB [Croceicoccus naphthovorans]|uniref:Phosphoserine phosphatase n=1 Tax=Croceicoccus naphthovorans TaxID=1348774 RepID=A0A0G3XEY4_9SPHN|nr:phosphoserine phosphatase SerB [Croceicoccus naphthovorans]AKM09762.1 phosphoserine phosphatase [Croceicoccus naphthovorans]MBB3990692.1 phosphoserine phosphatase [Croceicoccus naphthovorans]
MLIARLIADPAILETALAKATAELERAGAPIAQAAMLDFCSDVLEVMLPHGDPATVRGVLEGAFGPCDMLMADKPITVPQLFVSDMDSTMIGQECIDELADFAGLKERIADITERAMQGELDFASALTERVGLLAGLEESAITRCLDERIRPMPGARVLVETLKARGCRTVLVTGGFHSFADPVAEMLGFERVVGNVLGVAGGKLTGKLAAEIVDSGTKLATLNEEMARLGDGAVSLATGDGANDIPMIEAADYGVAYYAKPKAKAAANGFVDRGDLTSVLKLLGVPQSDWVD